MTSLNIFSKHLHWLNWNDAAKTASDIGFDGLDLTVRPGGHVEPGNVESDLPKAIELCDKEGIRVEMICTGIQDVSEPYTENIIKTAAELGVKSYRMDWLFYDEHKTIRENLSDIKSKLIYLAEMNEKYGIKGSYQNHDGTWFGASVWDLAIMLNEINSGWLGCQYDILNATIEGVNSWPHGFEYISPFIHSIDIKDAYWVSNGGRPKLKYSPIGTGMVEWEKFNNLVNKFNLDIPFSFHFEYELGGAEIGNRELSIHEEEVINNMKQDLITLEQLMTLK